MNEMLAIIVFGFFLIVSIIDWKFKAVPSVFMTGMLLVVAVVNLQNLPFAIICYILAILIKDFDNVLGVADVKSTVIIGFMLSSVQQFFNFAVILVLIGFLYTFMMRAIQKDGEFPFLPVYLITYTLLLFEVIL